MRKVYKASANCTAGRIAPIDGKSYSLVGVWDNTDIGEGRSRWRDASGKIVGRDNASGGLSISQQWELLCPASATTAMTGNSSIGAAPGKQRATAALPASEFAVGQQVLARYGSNWLGARVNRIHHSNGPGGPRTHYDVTLESGQRGGVPARMLRAQE